MADLLQLPVLTALLPPQIAELDVDVSREAATEAAEAANALTRFDASMASVLGGEEVSPLAAVLLRTESASSSQIEQIAAGAKALALASIGESDRPNAALVAANVAAMEKAIALSDRISAETIIDVHWALLHDIDPAHSGAFRTEPVWIGARGSSPHTASFVAPRSAMVRCSSVTWHGSETTGRDGCRLARMRRYGGHCRW